MVGREHIRQRVDRDLSAGDALRASEAMYRALFERSSDAILIADVETKRFRYANSAASRLLGYAETELHTMGFADIHPTDAANDTNLLERVVQSGFALIRKPLTPGALLRKVQEVFTRSAAPS